MKKCICVLMTLLMLLGSFALADSEIVVTGVGEGYVSADTATVVLGVSADDPNVRKAQATVNSTIASVREALIGYGIPKEDINTDTINIYSTMDYSSSGEPFNTYHASSNLSIRTKDLSIVGNLIDLAFDAGANTLMDIYFSATDTAEAQEAALRLAVENGKTQAEIIADATGLKLKDLDKVVVQNASYYATGVSNYGAGNFSMKDEAASTVVQASKICVTASLQMSFDAE